MEALLHLGSLLLLFLLHVSVYRYVWCVYACLHVWGHVGAFIYTYVQRPDIGFGSLFNHFPPSR